MSPSHDPGQSSLVRLENSLGAALLRARLLGEVCPSLAGRYEIHSILGRGASGVVVRAMDLRLQRDVALKLVPVSGPADEVLREARTLAKLEHRHIVPVYDVELVETVVGEPVRVAYVSMRLIDGSSMRVWLASASRDPATIIEKYIAAGSALAAAHEAGVLHRDFKPDNVVVDTVGHAYVVDFGLAAHGQSSLATGGAPSEAHGTFPYMAPEALAGRATSASDQYALAASMRESLAGSKVHAHVRRSIDRAMHADPAQRFKDVDAFLRSLAPRRQWLWGVAALTLVLALGVGVVATRRDDSVPNDEATAAHASEATTACEQLPPNWEFITTVDTISPNTVELGAQGRYEASFRRQGGCSFAVELRRTSDRHPGTQTWPDRVVEFGTAPVTLQYDAPSSTLAGEFRPPRRGTPGQPVGRAPAEYSFGVRFHDDRVHGEFSATAAGQPYSGTLAGAARTVRPEENRHDL